MTMMMAPAHGATFNDVRRRLAEVTQARPPAASAVLLEMLSRGVQDSPTLREAELLESGGMRAQEVGDARTPGFTAFLDGAQWTPVFWIENIPIAHGTVAVVIRQRRERRLTTWRAPIVKRALYAPLSLLSARSAEALAATGLEVVDTLAKRRPASGHPFELQEIAYQSVLGAREMLEKELAEQWCDSTDAALFVDGGIGASGKAAKSASVVGVVKSHQKLYAREADLPIVLQLRPGERSSVVRIAESKRAPVASWYLRLRDSSGQEPFWGLVRVEIAERRTSDARLKEHANEVSRWIVAEALPLSVPDARWDKMVYGIRDCEQYLRAIQ